MKEQFFLLNKSNSAITGLNQAFKKNIRNSLVLYRLSIPYIFFCNPLQEVRCLGKVLFRQDNLDHTKLLTTTVALFIYLICKFVVSVGLTYIKLIKFF